MQLPSPLGLLFLAYILLGLPWLAYRSAARLAGRDPTQSVPSRRQVWQSVVFMQLLMLGFAWLTGREFGYRFLAWEGFTIRAVVATIPALAGLLVLRVVVRRSRTDAERRELAVFKFAPRTSAEWRATVLMIGVTAVSEEIAYRGVAHALLWWMFGNGYLAAGLAAAGFAGAHAVQGRKSMAMVFVIALVMHALVAATGTLFLAMAVHAAFDLYAGWRIALEAPTLVPQEP